MTLRKEVAFHIAEHQPCGFEIAELGAEVERLQALLKVHLCCSYVYMVDVMADVIHMHTVLFICILRVCT
jgi:hypothetical protein